MTPEKISLNEQARQVAEDCRLVTAALIKHSQINQAGGAGQPGAEMLLSKSSEVVAHEPEEVLSLIVAGLSAQIQALELCASDADFDLGTQRALIANGQEIASDVRQHLVHSTTPRPSDLDFKKLAEMKEQREKFESEKAN